MKLEHLIQSYNFNKIPARIKEEKNTPNEIAGVIEFYNGIAASYLLGLNDTVISIKLYINCLTREALNLSWQLSHITNALLVIQQTIMLLSNISQKECNILLAKLGLFNNTFQKRKTNKIFRSHIQDRINRWIIMFKYK